MNKDNVFRIIAGLCIASFVAGVSLFWLFVDWGFAVGSLYDRIEHTIIASMILIGYFIASPIILVKFYKYQKEENEDSDELEE